MERSTKESVLLSESPFGPNAPDVVALGKEGWSPCSPLARVAGTLDHCPRLGLQFPPLVAQIREHPPLLPGESRVRYSPLSFWRTWPFALISSTGRQAAAAKCGTQQWEICSTCCRAKAEGVSDATAISFGHNLDRDPGRRLSLR